MSHSTPQTRQTTFNQLKRTAIKALLPITAISDTNALTHFDFSQFPPKLKSTEAALSDDQVQRISEKLLDDLKAAFMQHDTPTVIKCYEALHFCMGLNMESQRLNFAPHGKVAFLMTIHQTAALFNYEDMVTLLFHTCLASPDHPIRAGISAPVPMIMHAYSAAMQRDFSQGRATWMNIVDDMIKAFVDRLVEVAPDELSPEAGVLFEQCRMSERGHTRDVLTLLCSTMSDRYRTLIAQSCATRPPQTFQATKQRL